MNAQDEVTYNGYFATIKEISIKSNTAKIITPLFKNPVWVGIDSLKLID